MRYEIFTTVEFQTVICWVMTSCDAGDR